MTPPPTPPTQLQEYKYHCQYISAFTASGMAEQITQYANEAARSGWQITHLNTTVNNSPNNALITIAKKVT